MKGQFTFSKEEKLTGKTSIDQLFNGGKSFSLFPFKVFIRIIDASGGPMARLLIAIPKKKVKNAVDRNRLRRLVREAYRLNRHAFITFLENNSLQLHIALVYTGEGADLTYKDVELKVIRCLARIETVITSESGKGIR
jgi:ribonuclease P protein component